jgi:hypothetical protein
LREDDAFASVSSVAVSSSIPHRIIRSKDGAMRMGPGVSRFCSSFSSRVLRRRARAREGGETTSRLGEASGAGIEQP